MRLAAKQRLHLFPETELLVDERISPSNLLSMGLHHRSTLLPPAFLVGLHISEIRLDGTETVVDSDRMPLRINASNHITGAVEPRAVHGHLAVQLVSLLRLLLESALRARHGALNLGRLVSERTILLCNIGRHAFDIDAVLREYWVVFPGDGSLCTECRRRCCRAPRGSCATKAMARRRWCGQRLNWRETRGLRCASRY
jgi:hypothetical protein